MSWISIRDTKRYQLSYKALGKLLFLILLSFTKLYNFRKITSIYRDHYHMSIVLLCRGLFHDEYYFIIKLRHQLFFEVSKDKWNRLDLTFSANGADSKYIGDGSNYLDVYQY